MENRDKYLIIAAAGSGQRMINITPKQFLEINSKPIIVLSIDAFKDFVKVENTIVVISKDQENYWNTIKNRYPHLINCKTAIGGPSRFHSIKSGLKLIPDNSMVAIHDAARPFVSKSTIDSGFKTAAHKGTAIPVISINDSLRKVSSNTSKIVKREKIKIVQTPQIFKSELIKKSYKQSFNINFTDDASVVEKSGFDIFLTEGNKENFKITTSFDIEFAEFILKRYGLSNYTEQK